jgi:hypothetical protein
VPLLFRVGIRRAEGVGFCWLIGIEKGGTGLAQ